MALYAIADTHLSLGADKPMDVFGGWDRYVERLEKNWRALITPEDTVVIAGDISWAMKLENTREDFRFLESLPGEKILLKGNHDYWWSTRTKMERFLEEEGLHSLKILFNNSYFRCGVHICGAKGWPCDTSERTDEKISARELGRLTASLSSAAEGTGERVAFLHYPPYGHQNQSLLMHRCLVENGVRRCYYGHLHAAAVRRAFCGTADGVDYRLISADSLHFCPVLVQKGPEKV